LINFKWGEAKKKKFEKENSKWLIQKKLSFSTPPILNIFLPKF
jgi:hypothetical protein